MSSSIDIVYLKTLVIAGLTASSTGIAIPDLSGLLPMGEPLIIEPYPTKDTFIKLGLAGDTATKTDASGVFPNFNILYPANAIKTARLSLGDYPVTPTYIHAINLAADGNVYINLGYYKKT